MLLRAGYEAKGSCLPLKRSEFLVHALFGSFFMSLSSFTRKVRTVFTHFDEQGNSIMVDISDKNNTKRVATACGEVLMSPSCFKIVQSKNIKKGDVLEIARLAGIMSTKQTSFIIPLCHNISIEKVIINFEENDKESSIKVFCTVTTTGKTGVEMEALTGASTALLTIYNMCKSYDKTMVIKNIYLQEKKGGKSGHFINNNFNT